MKTSTTKNKYIRILQHAAAILFWLTVWQLVCMALHNELLLPSPFSVIGRLFALIGTIDFWQNIAISLGRILQGFGWGVLLGVSLGICASVIPFLHSLLRPVLTVIQATPVTSFVILALVWIKSYQLSVFISFLMVFPMIYAAIYQGIQQADPQLLEVAKVYRFSFWKTVRLVYLPAIAPLLITALTTAVGFGWKAGVAGEVLAVPRIGIGTKLYQSKAYLEMTDLFCWTLTIILLSILVEQILLLLARHWLAKKR